MKRVLVGLLALSACTSNVASERKDEPFRPPPPPPSRSHALPESAEELAKLQASSSRFAKVAIEAPLEKLSVNDRKALALLIRAARLTDALFLRQMWAGNEGMLFSLLENRGSPMGEARLQAFLLNKGPWSRLDENAIIIPGAPAKPHAGNFYPAGATKTEVEKWIANLPADQKAGATGFFTTIRRGPDGKFISVPYSLEYQGELAEMAALLKEAATLTDNPSLRTFLNARAEAFLSNDYYQSDVAWMRLDAPIEPTIGPYEVYEDEWFNYKAAFETFLTLRDDAETGKLAKFSAELQEIENKLPIAPKYRNPQLGALAPIRVVNSLFSAGDGNRGVQTAAFNLPNDEKIAAEMGTKRVMLKNIQEAKFKHVLTPIAQVALSQDDIPKVDFEAFFTHILMHELMHGLGPHNITVKGEKTTVRQALMASSSAIEEAKADISGLFALQHLIDKGVLAKEMEDTMYVTFLASAFRSLRFGLSEAHGKGIAVQLNYLLDQGGFRVNEDGTFAVDTTKIKEGVRALTAEFMTLQAEGNKARADQLLKTLGVVRPSVQAVLDRLKDVPVDIQPEYVTADRIEAEFATLRPQAPAH